MRSAHIELPGLEEKTQFLLKPEVYPEETASVRLVETHMARIFLTDHFVYKMKKPVHFSYLDFSSLDKRYGACSEELRLNRRLTDDVYLEVVAIRMSAANGLRLSGTGTPVEWLVKMRRLPEKACLAEQIGAIQVQALEPILQRLKNFYRTAAPISLTADQYLTRLRQRVESVRQGLCVEKLALDRIEIQSLTASLTAFTHSHGKLIGQRVATGPIVEGHGDLRPEHCFLTQPPQVIDCLEFNYALRCVDPLDELCYLALECELLGRSDLATIIVNSYSMDGAPDPRLVDFYQCYRALLRAQLAAAHLLDDDITDISKWQRKTRMYLNAAELHRPTA